MSYEPVNDMLPVASATEAFDAFEYYIRDWRERLVLDTWRVTVIRDDTEEAYAACYAMPKYMKVNVSANPIRMFEDAFTPLMIESTAIHELVHAILWTAFNDLANPKIPEDVVSYFEETTTEHVAEALLRAKYPTRPEVRGMWNQYRILAGKTATTVG